MKAITLHQPWASLIAVGAKKVETRSWQSNYVGPLAIHAGTRREDIGLALQQPFLDALRNGGVDIDLDKDGLGLPFGAVLAVARLAMCIQITAGNRPDPPELVFGDYSTGRFAWHLTDVIPLMEPLPARGQLGLWEWQQPDWIMKEIA